MSSIGSTTGPKFSGSPRIAITTGEPAGIGPEISLAALAVASDIGHDALITLIGDGALLEQRARMTEMPWPAAANLEHVPLRTAAIAGRRDSRNAHTSSDARLARRGAMAGEYAAT